MEFKSNWTFQQILPIKWVWLKNGDPFSVVTYLGDLNEGWGRQTTGFTKTRRRNSHPITSACQL